MNHTLAYAPKGEALIRKTNAILAYATDRVIVKFKIENTTVYTVARVGEKLEDVFQKAIENRGGVVEKKYYPEFNASQIERIKIGETELRNNIHFFIGKSNIPMVSNGDNIEFPNASEIRIDGRTPEFCFSGVDFQVNPTDMKQMGQLYQGGVGISPGAREIMNGQRSREKIACAHGETRTQVIDASSDNMIVINHETGEIMSVAEINSEKRIQTIREEKIVLQPALEIVRISDTQERFGGLDSEMLQTHQNIANLYRETINERRQVEERATTIEFGGLKVANDNAEYRVEIIREDGLGRISIVKEIEYKEAKEQKITSIAHPYKLSHKNREIRRNPQQNTEIPKEQIIQKTKKVPKQEKTASSEELDKTETIRIDEEERIPRDSNVAKEKQVLKKVNYIGDHIRDKPPEIETKPKETKNMHKPQKAKELTIRKKEEKIDKQKEKKFAKSHMYSSDKIKGVKAKRKARNNIKKEVVENEGIKIKKMKKQKIHASKLQKNEKTRIKPAQITNESKVKKNKNQKITTNQILGEKTKQRRIKKEENKAKKTKKQLEKNKEKSDKKRKIKKYFFNEFLGLFTKKKKVNKLKRN